MHVVGIGQEQSSGRIRACGCSQTTVGRWTPKVSCDALVAEETGVAETAVPAVGNASSVGSGSEVLDHAFDLSS